MAERWAATRVAQTVEQRAARKAERRDVHWVVRIVLQTADLMADCWGNWMDAQTADVTGNHLVEPKAVRRADSTADVLVC